MKADGARRLAAVFISPRIPPKYEEEFEVSVNSMIHAINSVSGAARAWIFPERARKLTSERTAKLYPGAAIVVAEA
jgi:hypothetical protein